MLHVTNLSRSFGAHTVFHGVSFVVNRDERVGLVGPNGCGKSTLLRCIAGQDRADAGEIALAPGVRVALLPQSADDSSPTLDEALAGAQPEFLAAEAALARATQALTLGEPGADALYDRALATFEALGGYARLERASAVVAGLGLAGIERQRPVATLSGGQKTRLALAGLLLAAPDLLLLDEPTNHLDVEALEWLEEFVRTWPGAVVVVSHDREFLDRTVGAIVHLDARTGTLRRFSGTYRDFAAQRAHEAELQARTWKVQQEYVGRVRGDIARLKGEALDIERSTTPREPGVRKFAKRKAKVAKAREAKLERFLASGERVERPPQGWSVKLDFGAPVAMGREVLRCDGVAFRYPGAADQVFNGASFHVLAGDRIAIVGPNGAGKTTLLRLLDGRLAPTAGAMWRSSAARLGTLTQEQETLDPARTVLATALAQRPMAETEARSFLHLFLFAGDSVFRPVGLCSPGERARLQLALLVLRGCNVLLLDEPLNHLDIEGREHFEQALESFPGTVLAVAHDRRFLRGFARGVLEVADGRVTAHAGGYEDYERRRLAAVMTATAPSARGS